jgi:hypothetical protein
MIRRLPTATARLAGSPGDWLQRIAVAHGAVGVALHHAALADLLHDRVVASVPDHGERATAFWFLIAAPLLWTSGRLLRSAERSHDAAAQRRAGQALIASGAIGIAAMPVSGFWSLLAVGIASLRRARRNAPFSTAQAGSCGATDISSRGVR